MLVGSWHNLTNTPRLWYHNKNITNGGIFFFFCFILIAVSVLFFFGCVSEDKVEKVGTVGDSDQVVSSLANWNCYADDYSAEQAYVGDDQMDGTISPGKKLKGSVYFEVPKKAKKITLEYECNFWTEDKIVFVAKK